MPRSQPYQPLLLRLLHGTHAILTLGGAITGFWMYNTWDKRFGYLTLSIADQNLYYFHLTLGNIFSVVMPAFAIYSFWAGRLRLVQPNSLTQLTLFGKPIWWYTLHRIVNTGLLIATGVALISGRYTRHNGLLKGILSDNSYNIHLISWVVIVMLFTAHLLMTVKVGGISLIISIIDSKVKPKDSPFYRIKKLFS